MLDSSPIFPNAIYTLKQSLTLTNISLKKLELNTWYCCGDLENLYT